MHDLNFANARYETKQIFAFKNPKGALLEALRNSGPIPGEAVTNGVEPPSKKRTSEIGAGAAGPQKKKKASDGKAIDMDKLADGLQKLGEDDLLQVVQMVHDNKSEESWMRNDVERTCPFCPPGILIADHFFLTEGEFHVDLYTLPEPLIKMLWEFANDRNAISASG